MKVEASKVGRNHWRKAVLTSSTHETWTGWDQSFHGGSQRIPIRYPLSQSESWTPVGLENAQWPEGNEGREEKGWESDFLRPSNEQSWWASLDVLTFRPVLHDYPFTQNNSVRKANMCTYQLGFFKSRCYLIILIILWRWYSYHSCYPWMTEA